ncbi:MAG: hypothetical protein DME66_03955, partial [Verrucomicrobia bacterium]
CSVALAVSAFAQVPAVSPAVSPTQPIPAVSVAPSATTAASGDLGDQIRRRFDKKFKKGVHMRVGSDKDAVEDKDADSHGDDIPSRVIPIVVVTMLTVFGAPVLIVAVIMYFGFSKTRALHRTVRLMVEKGQEVPAALLNPPPAQRQRSDMRRGVLLLMVGLGLVIFLGVIADWDSGVWTLGMIPALIGAGYLLVWKLEGRKDNPPSVE